MEYYASDRIFATVSNQTFYYTYPHFIRMHGVSALPCFKQVNTFTAVINCDGKPIHMIIM